MALIVSALPSEPVVSVVSDNSSSVVDDVELIRVGTVVTPVLVVVRAVSTKSTVNITVTVSLIQHFYKY